MPLAPATSGNSVSSACTSSSAHGRSTGSASTSRPYRVSRPFSINPRDVSRAIASRYAVRSSGTGKSRPLASTPMAAQVSATRSASPANWNSGGAGFRVAKSSARSERITT